MQDDAQNNRVSYWNTYWIPYNKSTDKWDFNEEMRKSIQQHSHGLSEGEYTNDYLDDEGGKFKERAKDSKTFESDVKGNIDILARAYYFSKLNEYSEKDSFPKSYNINSRETLLSTVTSPETDKYINELHSNELFYDAIKDNFANSKDIKDLSDLTHVLENVDFNQPKSEDTQKFTNFFKGVDKVYQSNILFEATHSKGKEM